MANDWGRVNVFRSAVRAKVDDITGGIIAGAIQVHRSVGPGLLERVYVACLRRELTLQGFDVKTEVPIQVVYRGETLDITYRADMVVDDTVVVEVKSIQEFHSVHVAQAITYVTLLQKPVGLLLNFGAPLMRDGILRVLPRQLPDSGAP